MTQTKTRRPSVVPERLAWNGWGLLPPLPLVLPTLLSSPQVSRFQSTTAVSSRQGMGTTDAPGRTRTDALKAATPGLYPTELRGHLSHYSRPPAQGKRRLSGRERRRTKRAGRIDASQATVTTRRHRSRQPFSQTAAHSNGRRDRSRMTKHPRHQPAPLDERPASRGRRARRWCGRGPSSCAR